IPNKRLDLYLSHLVQVTLRGMLHPRRTLRNTSERLRPHTHERLTTFTHNLRRSAHINRHRITRHRRGRRRLQRFLFVFLVLLSLINNQEVESSTTAGATRASSQFNQTAVMQLNSFLSVRVSNLKNQRIQLRELRPRIVSFVPEKMLDPL